MSVSYPHTYHSVCKLEALPSCIAFPRRTLKSNSLLSMNATFDGVRVFADDNVKMRSLGWALAQDDYDLIKTRELGHKGKTCTEERHKRRHHVKIKAEIR